MILLENIAKTTNKMKYLITIALFLGTILDLTAQQVFIDLYEAASEDYSQRCDCPKTVKRLKAALQVEGIDYSQRQKATTLLEKAQRCDCAKPKPPATLSYEPETVNITGGTFDMGDVMQDNEQTDETVHSVYVSNFAMGKYELTLDQFKAFIDDEGYTTDADKNGSYIWTGSEWKIQKGVNWKCDIAGNIRSTSDYKHPVIHVSWNDATAYCEWLSKKTSKKYRLPTEAEWEYAAREGGKKVRFGNGKNTADASEINFDARESYRKSYSNAGVYREKTTAVGSFAANSLGLYDMAGNVWEWCSDWYGSYSSSYQSNPTGAATGSIRVNRGGGWGNAPRNCRAASRSLNSPANCDSRLGFRVAFSQ